MLMQAGARTMEKFSFYFIMKPEESTASGAICPPAM
jgi:uncharacterized protein (DUF2461 family)